MKAITVGQLRQNPTAMLADVEAGATYAIVPHIKSLAAIHLASLIYTGIIYTGIDATVVTHDATMAHVAELLGYPVVDPVTDG